MKKYKYSVPIMNSTVNADTRDEYLSLLREARAERVFLAVSELWDDEKAVLKNIAALKENIAFFEKNGIEAAIWQGVTVGHGVVLSHDTDAVRMKNYSPLVNIDGETIGDTRCPLDEDFRRDLSEYITRLARETGARLILLDDDFRISQHGSVFCCACEKHLALMSEICGEVIKREDIAEKVFASKANKYRAAYLKAMGDSLRGLSSEIRRAMDEFDPAVRIGICSASCSWNYDGVAALEISKILAGNTKPCLRLTGAPYWAVVRGRSMSMVMENERMLHSLCPDGEIELMAEGDVYPRPRYVVPAAYLEIFDAVIRADGFDGNLKYMFDYNTSPYYEPSYIKHHCRNLPLHEEVGKMFDGKKRAGVRVFVSPEAVETADYTLSLPNVKYDPLSLAGEMLQNCGIPTFYGEGESDAVAVFGENARHIPLDMIKNGAIVDGVAAVILTERGIDLGLVGNPALAPCQMPFMKTETEESISVQKGEGRFIYTPISDKAKITAKMIGGEGLPVAYRYKNADGGAFTVFTFDSGSLAIGSGLIRGYAIEKILLDGINEIAATSEKKLSAHCPNAPELYTLCARGEGKMAVGLFNCYADSVLDPVIDLDHSYRTASFIGCDGKVEGDKLYLTDIPAFKFAAVELCE